VGYIDIDGMKHFLMSTSGIGYQKPLAFIVQTNFFSCYVMARSLPDW
jgi:hypothetical protein